MTQPSKRVEELVEAHQHAFDSLLLNHNPISPDKQFGACIDNVLTKYKNTIITQLEAEKQQAVEEAKLDSYQQGYKQGRFDAEMDSDLTTDNNQK